MRKHNLVLSLLRSLLPPRSVTSFGVPCVFMRNASHALKSEREKVTLRTDVATIASAGVTGIRDLSRNFTPILNRLMCGLVNKKMNAQEVVEELTQVCIQMRFHLDDLTERREKETLVLKHIKRFENSGSETHDFPKGTGYLDRAKRVP